MGGNITVDPRERATPVDDPAIIEARSRRTGRLLDANLLIRSFDYAAVIGLRGILKDAASRGRARLVCPMCGVTLFLASSMRKNFYLRHRQALKAGQSTDMNQRPESAKQWSAANDRLWVKAVMADI